MSRSRQLWIFGWMLAVYAMYTCVVGQSAFLPIYLAEGYLWLFALALTTYRAVTMNRDTDLRFATFAVMYVTALGAAFVLGYFAPTIGERNYCAAVTSDPGLPPRVFRCTAAPLEFAGFVAGFWLASWILERLIGDGSAEEV